MFDVSIVRCDSYDRAEVRRALLEALEPVGGLDFIKPGQTVALKANLVSPKPPEAAATTHPALLAELVALIVARGARAVVGDSPAASTATPPCRAPTAPAGCRPSLRRAVSSMRIFRSSPSATPAGAACASFYIPAGWPRPTISSTAASSRPMP